LQYVPKCGVCHGADLKGGGAPELLGKGFRRQMEWQAAVGPLTYIRQQMPKGNGDSLSPQEYADITAFILSRNAIPAGNIKYTADSPMSRVMVLSDAAPTDSAESAPAEEVKLGELSGPVRQPTTHGPSQAELDAADNSTSDWLMYNKGYKGERYSKLSALNAHTATKLKPGLHRAAR